MVRISMIALLSLVCMASGGCQSYTTGLQKSAESSNEVAAIAALQFIATAQASYKAVKGDYGTFQQLHDANYLDSRFNSSKPEMAGYAFTMLIQKSEGEPPRFTSTRILSRRALADISTLTQLPQRFESILISRRLRRMDQLDSEHASD